ncbi:hypothetical protein BO82DRAFT_356552 [Aspergillus uvarum CBS 121591]|uniref:Uncharacterized protein n=1 Tax=Aspergillus uvarum CBS 121591 TaxID=1448315 RepID=A0A319C2P3_9EURO|nr:hypothetical protein BO82DRAFT_356552 [Aspergillus uvarum CBS 121591]PYH79375.1 hypothetical protein BO82DRAFT_356552 [Aspergillus uvarum CBS 121591]
MASKHTSIQTHQITPEAAAALHHLQGVIETAPVAKVEKNKNIMFANHFLDQHAAPLLKHLELEGKTHLSYMAWKILARNTIRNSTGPLYIVPVRVVTGTEPRLVPRDAEMRLARDPALVVRLVPGSYVCFDGAVDLLPGLTCLVITRVRRRG